MDLRGQLDNERRRRETAENAVSDLKSLVAEMQQQMQLLGDVVQATEQRRLREQSANETAIENMRAQLREAETRLSDQRRVQPTQCTAGDTAASPDDACNGSSNVSANADLPARVVTVFRSEGGTKSFDDRFINLIRDGKCGKILPIIKNHSAEDLVDSDGTHLLHLLAKFNNTDVIKYCIASKYSFDVKDSSGLTPTLTAVLHERYELASTLHQAHVKTIIEREIEREIENKSPQFRSLMNAVSCQHVPRRMTNDISVRLLREIVAKLKAKRLDLEQICMILVKLYYRLEDVVRLYDPDMTEAFLRCVDESDILGSGLRGVVATFDWKHIRVLINHQPNSQSSLKKQFLSLLVDNISKYHESEDGRDFLKHAFTWEICNEDTLECFEKSLEWAKSADVTLFLQYGFHSIAEANCGRDIRAALFANSYLDIDLVLKNEKIDVDKRYDNGNTALHISANNRCAKIILWLLEKGADPNALNEQEDTPLILALDDKYLNKECVELLLLGGADPTIVNDHLSDGIFDSNAERFMKIHEGVAKLVAAHLAIKEASGVSIERAVQAYTCFAYENVQTFLKECVRQANELKSCRIRDIWTHQQTTFTMFTLLAERPENIAHLFKEEDLEAVDKILKCKGASRPVYYHTKLEKHAKDIAKIKHLRNRATFVTCQFTGIQDPHHLVIKKIVHYFKMKDLLIFK